MVTIFPAAALRPESLHGDRAYPAIYGARHSLRRKRGLRILPLRWISVGLLVAAVTGLGPWLFSRPFLTSYFNYLNLPIIGDIPTASAVLFDFGVFALVLGATALMLVALAHQSIRSHRCCRAQRRTSEPWSLSSRSPSAC